MTEGILHGCVYFFRYFRRCGQGLQFEETIWVDPLNDRNNPLENLRRRVSGKGNIKYKNFIVGTAWHAQKTSEKTVCLGQVKVT